MSTTQRSIIQIIPNNGNRTDGEPRFHVAETLALDCLKGKDKREVAHAGQHPCQHRVRKRVHELVPLHHDQRVDVVALPPLAQQRQVDGRL